MRSRIVSIFGALFLLLLPLTAGAVSGPDLRFATQGDTITVTWDAVEGAFGYEIKYGPVDQEGFAHELDLGTSRDYSFTLAGTKVFKVAVTAYDDNGKLIAVSNLDKVELPAGDVLGYFFLELAAEYGTTTLPMGQGSSSAGAWVSVYSQGADGKYNIYGLGDATFYLYFSAPIGNCTYTMESQGQFYITGNSTPYSGEVDLTLRQVYNTSLTTDGHCFGIPIPDVPFNQDWPRDIGIPLEKGSWDFGSDFKMKKYDVIIWETSLDGCPGC
jgi:hypothetical protein